MMSDVLVNSLLFLLVLAALCFAVVKLRGQGQPWPSLKNLPALLGSKREKPAAAIVVHQRSLLGWKSAAVDIGWQGKRYLLVLQEGRCTVIDSHPEPDSFDQPPHE